MLFRIIANCFIRYDIIKQDLMTIGHETRADNLISKNWLVFARTQLKQIKRPFDLSAHSFLIFFCIHILSQFIFAHTQGLCLSNKFFDYLLFLCHHAAKARDNAHNAIFPLLNILYILLMKSIIVFDCFTQFQLQQTCIWKTCF